MQPLILTGLARFHSMRLCVQLIYVSRADGSGVLCHHQYLQQRYWSLLATASAASICFITSFDLKATKTSTGSKLGYASVATGEVVEV